MKTSENEPISTPENSETAEANQRQGIAEFARQHPVLLLAGGAAIGLLAGAFVSKRSGGKFAQRAGAMAAAAGELGLALSRNARKSAASSVHDARDRIGRDTAAVRQKGSRLAGAAREAGLRLAEEAVTLASRHKR